MFCKARTCPRCPQLSGTEKHSAAVLGACPIPRPSGRSGLVLFLPLGRRLGKGSEVRRCQTTGSCLLHSQIHFSHTLLLSEKSKAVTCIVWPCSSAGGLGLWGCCQCSEDEAGRRKAACLPSCPFLKAVP